ncbi:MAG: hypothetical protein CMJ18_26345 [Phycisphaeraceae bacterium]|nr:hypothetical protein [Phycisphaeraceae bacterium]
MPVSETAPEVIEEDLQIPDRSDGSAEPRDWSHTLLTYGWIIGIDGDLTVGSFSTDVDTEFPLLISWFLTKFNTSVRKNIDAVPREAMDALVRLAG